MRADGDEAVLFSAHPCWRSMVGFHIRWMVLAVLAGAIAGLATLQAKHVQVRWVALAVVAVAGYSALRGLARRASTTYTLTDRRVVIEHGLMRRDLYEAPLWHVQDVFAHQSLRQRLLRVGSVHFDTAAGPEEDFCFLGVERPRDVIREVDRALSASRRAAREEWGPVRV